jgi:cell division protein FtsI/penicillin-binding protein 2
MAKQLQYRRLLMLGLLLGAAFVGLGYRLVDLQVLRHERLSAIAQRNTAFEAALEPRRGDILDCRGNVLATSAFVKTVYANPAFIGSHAPEVAKAVAPLLQMDEGRVLELMMQTHVNAKGETVPMKSVKLKEKVPWDTCYKIRTAVSNLIFAADEKKLPKAEQAALAALRSAGVYLDRHDDQVRIYPNQSLASHVVGYVLTEETITNGEANVDLVGRGGIEASFDTRLRGVRGWRVSEKGKDQSELVNFREQDVQPEDGLNVVLTLDSVIQHIVEGALAEAADKYTPVSISGIVVRPRTGEILAMASYPTFDANKISSASADALRNRVISDVAEPGSTFKIVVVSGALNDGTVKLSDVFDCGHGHFTYAGRLLHDHETYDDLSVESIITKSSNIGAAKVGIKMGEDRLYDYIRNFGFGQKTAIPLPAEVVGIVKRAQWTKVSIAQIPMGQGVAVTRLQMTMAMCAIANNGVLMRPMLVNRLEDRDHKVVAKFSPQRVRQVIGDSAVHDMVKALKTVVSPDGTAPKAALEHYTVAGKTGTAQKAIVGGYSKDKFFSSFIGFFPADNPELCVSITIDEPHGSHYGGQTAAPIFKQIAEKAANYLNIRPEDGADVPPLAEPAAAPVENHAALRASARSQ